MTDSKLGELEITYARVDEVEPHPENANIGDVDTIAESIRINGYYAPIIVQASTGYILAGNHRYRAARQLGYETVATVYLDVEDDEARRIMVADNRTTRIGHDDDAALASLLEVLGESEVGLLGTGYSQSDLQTLQDSLDKFDPEFKPEPEREADAWANAESWIIEPMEGPGGTASGVLIQRADRKPLSPEDYNRIRSDLGMGRANRGALATLGIEDWA